MVGRGGLQMRNEVRREGALASGWPVPPAALRTRVHGSADEQAFLDVGARIARDLVQAWTRDLRLTPGEGSTLLDFGAGCGRVLRALVPQWPGVRWCATDVDPAAVAWGQAMVPEVSWASNHERPPLPWLAARFDGAIAVSVFSHLEPPLALDWLRELRRVVRPGGVLLASVHGADLSPVKLHPGEMYWFPVGCWPELPHSYGVAYHTDRAIREQWALAGWRVTAIGAQGINGHQDLVVAEAR